MWKDINILPIKSRGASTSPLLLVRKGRILLIRGLESKPVQRSVDLWIFILVLLVQQNGVLLLVYVYVVLTIYAGFKTRGRRARPGTTRLGPTQETQCRDGAPCGDGVRPGPTRVRPEVRHDIPRPSSGPLQLREACAGSKARSKIRAGFRTRAMLRRSRPLINGCTFIKEYH